MRTNLTLGELIDQLVETALKRQIKASEIEYEPQEDVVDLEDILLSQHRVKRWLEEQ